MIQLAQHDKWKPVFLENLRAQVEEVLDIEKDTEHLEVEEKDSQWTLTSSHPQAQDDELAEVSLSSPNSRAISMTLTCSFTHPTVEEAERLSALQDLIRRKAQALDRLRVGEFEHPDEGKQALAEHLTSIGGRFWAIVIGINRYSDDEVPDLRGCLADTTLIVDYLLDTLKVPQQHILVLTSPLDNKHEVGCNGLPTRAAILAALYDHFRDNDAVQMGDNLLFYFAGYGSFYDGYTSFGASNMRTEAICPLDRGVNSSASIYDISGYELDIIFAEICKSKSLNLTVVLDCSFIGSNTRTFDGIGEHLGRRVIASLDLEDIALRMFECAAKDSRRLPVCVSSAYPYFQRDTSPYVLLVASQPYQWANEVLSSEDQPRWVGAFTWALVSALTSPTMGINATYVDLVAKMQLTIPQTPVVAGLRKLSRLWRQEDVLRSEAGI
ncbi:hypothetical protein PENSPDRAFT_263635 [Peniophora sp. CONT]|nr:hypothetical protein PENSPDRAFT_263635 [Peniophora sp. CONT]